MAYNPNLRRTKHGGYFDITGAGLSSQQFTSQSGIVDTKNNIKFSTDDELTEYRREQAKEWERQESQIERNKQEAQAAAKQNEVHKDKKPPRKAMKKQYTFGDFIDIDGQSYLVTATKTDNNGKILGYLVHDKDGKTWLINKFGEKEEW